MAKVKYGPLVTSVLGSFKEVTFSKTGRGRGYIRPRQKSRYNPNSTAQKNIRDSVTTSAKQWYNVLTSEQRYLWRDYANAHNKKSSV